MLGIISLAKGLQCLMIVGTYGSYGDETYSEITGQCAEVTYDDALHEACWL